MTDSADDVLEALVTSGFPSVADTLQWIEERAAGCMRIARKSTDADRDRWIEDTAYYVKALAAMRMLSGASAQKD